MYERPLLVALKNVLVSNMGELMKLSPANESVRVTLPKEDLHDLGLLDQDGNLKGKHWAMIERDGDSFKLNIVSP